MNPVLLAIRALNRRKPGRGAVYFTLATTGWRIARRVMSNRQRTLLQFEVKPGEVFEIRGIRRGR
jgi:hypothetical protein